MLEQQLEERGAMITKKELEDAPYWTIFEGQAEDPGSVGWALFYIYPVEDHPEDVTTKMSSLDVSLFEPEIDGDKKQPRGDVDDLDAALAYLRDGGKLCKVPDRMDSSYWRLLAVGVHPEEIEEVVYQFHLSERDIPLVWIVPPLPGEVVLTVENYCKWYSLYLIHEDGRVEKIPFPDQGWAQSGESAYADHVPNPTVVQRFAERKGYLLDTQAFEMIIGRWELEYVDAAGTKYGGDVEEEEEG
jgi:hypothetical protein